MQCQEGSGSLSIGPREHLLTQYPPVSDSAPCRNKNGHSLALMVEGAFLNLMFLLLFWLTCNVTLVSGLQRTDATMLHVTQYSARGGQ